MDGLEEELGDRANVIRVEIQTDAGDEASARYDIRFTPNFVVFDATGAAVARTTVVGVAASRLRSLAATP